MAPKDGVRVKMLNGFCNAARNAFGLVVFSVGPAGAAAFGAAVAVSTVDATADAPTGEAVDAMP